MYLEHVTEQAIQLANSTIHNFSVVNTIIQPNQIPHPGGKGYWCLAQFETIENIVRYEPLLRGQLSYKATLSLFQK
jgi:hypothetical protein